MRRSGNVDENPDLKSNSCENLILILLNLILARRF